MLKNLKKEKAVQIIEPYPAQRQAPIWNNSSFYGIKAFF
jgi:hypothetical protein